MKKLTIAITLLLTIIVLQTVIAFDEPSIGEAQLIADDVDPTTEPELYDKLYAAASSENVDYTPAQQARIEEIRANARTFGTSTTTQPEEDEGGVVETIVGFWNAINPFGPDEAEAGEVSADGQNVEATPTVDTGILSIEQIIEQSNAGQQTVQTTEPVTTTSCSDRPAS
ncbi:hypothetical protein GOV04_00610 [Candidatus Woesearchaeota archaeon]|nr:hypothetical protein [Candidatus Woesearchaeota archaeon]